VTETHALAIAPAAALPSPEEWRTVVEMAKVMVPTGLLPSTIRTPEQAVLIMLKGRELRVPPLHALSNIVVVNNKPACSAELMLALIYRDHGDEAVIVEESTPLVCRVSYKRRHWDGRRSFQFSIEDAKNASLSSDTWKKYPQAMLRARATSAVARLAFPDSLGGMYTPEELGATVRVTDGGEVEVAALPDAAPPPAATSPPAPAGELTPRAQAAVASWEATVAEADAEGRWQGERLEAARLRAQPWTVPADDVDGLVGKELWEACNKMKRLLRARELMVPPDPAERSSVPAWRSWWHDCVALLRAAEAAVPA